MSMNREKKPQTQVTGANIRVCKRRDIQAKRGGPARKRFPRVNQGARERQSRVRVGGGELHRKNIAPDS